MRKKLEPIAIGSVCLLVLTFWIMMVCSAYTPTPQPITQVVITKPALPKSVRHQWFRNEEQMDDFVGKCIRDGYVTKVAMGYYGDIGWFHGYVIAEKY